jgi:hypothetical protein
VSTVSFNADLQRFADKTGVKLDLVVRKVALDIYEKVTVKTPVDTGRARGNWNVSMGSPDLSVNNKATRAKRARLKKGDGEKVIFITNNLPYINALENGHSDQAPSGMLAVTLNEVEAGIRDVIRG